MAAADCLKISMQCVQEIARQVADPPKRILSAKQCKDLSSKLLEVIGNIQELVSSCEASAVVAFEPALEEFQRIVEEARMLVLDCCRKDWLKASLFQIRNEEAFRELLLKVGLCYNVIYEQAKTISLASGRVLKVEDLRSLPPSDSTFRPALEEDVREDQQTLQERLEEVTKSPQISDDVILARYLLSRLSAPAMSEECSLEVSSIMYNASTLQVLDREIKATWGLRCQPFSNVSGAVGVFKTQWLGIDCAKKIFFHSGRELHPVFGKEASILASINHPNIVKFFCCGSSTEDDEDQCFIGMERMKRSLSNLIEEHRKSRQYFPTHVALDIILQIARGMLYMHEYGTAHRDLKPDNVGVSKAPNLTFCVKLLDFGLSKTKVQVSKSSTVSQPNAGTTKYRAPEAFRSAKAQKVKWFSADVYSFAVTCYQILSLQEPYASIANTALYQKLKNGLRPTLPTDCPRPLSVLIEECWAGDFNARPSFRSIFERLEKFKHDLLLQGIRGENAVASTSSYAYIKTMLKRRSELRTPARHLAEAVENEGATSDSDEGYISEGDEGDDSAISRRGDDGAIGEPGVNEMECASERINWWTQPLGNPRSAWRQPRWELPNMASGEPTIAFGHHTIKGKSRHAMEDYYVAEVKKVKEHELGLFAIYDGHLGHNVAEYLQHTLFNNIVKQIDFFSDPQLAIQRAYKMTDEYILQQADRLGPGGSTAVTAILIKSRDLYVANVGNSRAVISKAGKAKQMSVDHEPGNKTEMESIEQKGGFVSNMPGDVRRVNGQLAVSRTFGDKSLKVHLSSVPAFKVEEVDETTECLILASDGLWKVMDNQEAVDLVKKIKDPMAAAKELAQEALNRKSKDDISCIVVRFPGAQ